MKSIKQIVKKILIVVFFFSLIMKTGITFAQGANDFDITKVPYIDVTTDAYREVVPDEIYISITLRERFDNKVKITIDSLERQFINALKENHIDIKNLSTRDLQSGCVKISWHNKDVMQEKEYSLKVSTADEVQNVFQIIYDQKINNSSIWKTDYSKRDSIEKVVRVEAINKATPQANYMLQPINRFAGKVLIMREENPANYANYYVDGIPMRGGDYAGYENNMGTYKSAPAVQFQKIKIQAVMFVRFQIGL